MNSYGYGLWRLSIQEENAVSAELGSAWDDYASHTLMPAACTRHPLNHI